MALAKEKEAAPVPTSNNDISKPNKNSLSSICDKAEQEYIAAYDIAHRAGNKTDSEDILKKIYNLWELAANNAMAHGRPEEAKKYYYREILIATKYKDLEKLPEIHTLVARIYVRMKQYDVAEEEYLMAYRIAANTGNGAAKDRTLKNLWELAASSAKARGKLNEAKRSYEHEITIAARYGNSPKLLETHIHIAKMYEETEEYDNAEQEYLTAYKVAEKAGNNSGKDGSLQSIYSLWTNAAIRAKTKGELQKAKSYYQRAISVAETYHDNSRLKLFSSELEKLQK